jgi:outer membrane protein assembly factor BamD
MKRSALRPLVVLAVLIAAGASLACRGGQREDPILRLAAAESLAEGKRLMEAGKYGQARKYLAHAFEVEPNSVSGREALLLVADALHREGGNSNLIQAEAKYRDFLNRFPTSDRAAYVQYQIGAALAGRVERPDRDQSVTHKAMVAFQEVVRLYPASEEAEQAQARIAELRGRLAEHEFQVARFYYRFGLPRATSSRLNYLLGNYPEYGEKDKVYFYLGMAHQRMDQPEEARQWFDKLRQEFPSSEFVGDIPRDQRG